jgi:hypothetical protein
MERILQSVKESGKKWIDREFIPSEDLVKGLVDRVIVWKRPREIVTGKPKIFST